MPRPKKSNVGNGFAKQPRTIEQVTQEYNHQCALAGHKSRLLKLGHSEIIKLEDEVKLHLEEAQRLNNEGAKLQAALKMAQPLPAQSAPTQTAPEQQAHV